MFCSCHNENPVQIYAMRQYLSIVFFWFLLWNFLRCFILKKEKNFSAAFSFLSTENVSFLKVFLAVYLLKQI